jgi:hypothetical protein
VLHDVGVAAGQALDKLLEAEPPAPTLISSPSNEGAKISTRRAARIDAGAGAEVILPLRRRPDGRLDPEPGDRKPGKSHKRILDALAWFEAAGIAEPTRNQLGWAAGYRADTGHFGNLLTELYGLELIDRRAGSAVLTAKGRTQAQEIPTGKMTAAILVARIKPKLSGPAGKLLDVLVTAYPKAVARDALAEATGYRADTGHFGNLISELTGPEIAVRAGKGEVRLADWVMLKT